jgi:hypothetical protein
VSFSTSSTRQALKEGDANRDKEHISQEYERVKNENLHNAKEGKGGWKNELASESEASVKADRDETGVNINLQEEIKVKEKKTEINKGGK